MFPKIELLIADRLTEFDLIPDERKVVLEKLAQYISGSVVEGKKTNLVYICIHNSRRSQFGQIAGAVAAYHYRLNLQTYSGGTVATAFNPNAIAALKNLGFNIEARSTSENARYEVCFADGKSTLCFSKIYDDPANPVSDFAAILTCGEAEENCPFIPNASLKISTTYEDPKSSDGSGRENATYIQSFLRILRETLYAFSLVGK